MERSDVLAEPLEAGLARASARVTHALAALASKTRVDLAGLPSGAAAMLLARANRAHGRPVVIVTPDVDAARRTAADLAFFMTGSEKATDDTSDAADGTGDVGDGMATRDVLLYPPSDTTPFVDVAPDRRAAMDRLAVLFHLAEKLPWKFLIVPAAGLVRRVPPRAAISQRSMPVRAEEELDRDDFIRVLTEGGYLRVPIAEDPGTFAVRGSLIDVYPPHASYPARIELDDYLVMSIKLFDPEDQRTVSEVKEIFVHPARDALLGPEELSLARDRVRHLCDEINLPTTRTRQLLDDLESGRMFYGIDRFLPGFYPELESLFDYLDPAAATIILDPTACVRAIEDELEQAKNDRGAKYEEGSPVFPLDAHYVDTATLADVLRTRPVVSVHRVAVGGAPVLEEEGALAFLEAASLDDVLQLGGEDQAPLVAELSAHRSQRGREDALAPLAERTRAWLEGGLRVAFTARTRTQAERLVSLLKGYELPVAPRVAAFDPKWIETAPAGRANVTTGLLSSGFVLASEGLVFVTEEEIFGGRTHRRPRKDRDRRDKAQPFLEDLRELKVGDYIVHVDHGVGRYLGLERKTLGQTQYERMRGDNPLAVETLVVEYSGGGKLYLPVTRLNQIQKFSGKEGQQPKLDKLGGQTFAKTKARVRQAVKQLADELLKLYAQRAASARDPLPVIDRSYAEFEATFPFDETRDQLRAIEDVLSDLEGARPMDRVVCGDVGFGKTEVALRAAFRVAMSGRQVALLCPTTVLAQQHFLTFRERFQNYPLRVEVLSRFVDRKDQTQVLTGIKEGVVDVVIGTHRLLSKDVHFKKLGLLVVDEEQRFGVTHKERIKQMRTEVDVLTLSATPIPRTLQMAVGGMRDLSLITTAPVDRRAVRTLVTRWDDHVLREAVQRELARGGQVFFVYNRIEGLYERSQRLQTLIPDARFAVAHGQMNESALERVMTDFVEGRYDVLCSTAIIESGLDIPRANTMIVDRADTFGLSQLYQIRGRVGRSRERAYCYLVTPPPSQMTDEARYRIEALERFTELGSGFQVASLDMELRGAGDLLGAEQSGNVAAVGFELFVQMLEEAVAQLKGETIVHEVDPELALDVEQFLPDDYIDDVGLRLSFYKRFADAATEDDVQDLATEMEDRFGAPPPAAVQFVRAMALKPALRELRVLGCEATRERVTLHLREDTPLDPARVLARVNEPRSPWKLSPDMKLSRRFDASADGDSIDRVQELLRALGPLRKDVN